MQLCESSRYNVGLQRILADIAAWTLFPFLEDEEAREEARVKFNLSYCKEKRPILLEAIKGKIAHPAILSDIRSLLHLPDTNYIEDTQDQNQYTLIGLGNLREEKEYQDHMRVFILLMELLMQSQSQASLNDFYKGPFFTKNRCEALKDLGSDKQYQIAYKKYKNVSHFILAYHFLKLNLYNFPNIYKAFANNLLIPFFKYCIFFKKQLLTLSNKHSKNEQLFCEEGFASVSLEGIALTAQEESIFNKGRDFIWSEVRNNMLSAAQPK